MVFHLPHERGSRFDTAMRVDLIETTDRRLAGHAGDNPARLLSLARVRLARVESTGGTAVAAYVEQPGVRLLPVIRRAIPSIEAFELVSPYGLSVSDCTVPRRRNTARCVLRCGANAA